MIYISPISGTLQCKITLNYIYTITDENAHMEEQQTTLKLKKQHVSEQYTTNMTTILLLNYQSLQ